MVNVDGVREGATAVSGIVGTTPTVGYESVAASTQLHQLTHDTGLGTALAALSLRLLTLFQKLRLMGHRRHGEPGARSWPPLCHPRARPRIQPSTSAAASGWMDDRAKPDHDNSQPLSYGLRPNP